MDYPIKLRGGCLSSKDVEATKAAVFSAIKNALPEEAHFSEAISYVLKECEDELQTKRVEL